MSTFQIITLGVAIFIIVGSVAVFALQRGQESQSKSTVEIWGIIPSKIVNEWSKRINEAERESVNFKYTEIEPDEFEKRWIDAMAAGTGPDIVIIPDDLTLKHQNKLFLIDYKFFTNKKYKDSFIESAEVLLRNNGIIGFPLTIDPLVMYWNRTILNNDGISSPPRFWDDLFSIIPRLVRRDTAANISRPVIALGEYQNIDNAKEVLIAMIQQAGNNLITLDQTSNTFESVLDKHFNFSTRPADAALSFFLQFSNPTRDVYTWNRSMPSSKQMFLSGDLVFYIGYASERDIILQKNPNLNFDVAVLPQSKAFGNNIEINKTLGQMNLIAISRNSSKISSSFNNVLKLIEPQNIKILSELTGLPTVRRDVVIPTENLSYAEVFNRSALFSIPFLDPGVSETSNIFKSMIESVLVGNLDVNRSVQRAHQEISNMLK